MAAVEHQHGDSEGEFPGGRVSRDQPPRFLLPKTLIVLKRRSTNVESELAQS